MPDSQVEAHAAIDAVLQRQIAAWNAGDAEAFGADIRADVVFTNVLGVFISGKPGFDKQHAYIFSGMYKDSRMRQTVEQIMFVRPDVAVIDTLTEIEGGGPFPPGFPRNGEHVRTRLEQVMVHDNGRWWVVAFHNVLVPPDLPGTRPA